MAIQSSVNALMQQLYTIGAIGAGLREQKKQTKGQEKTANEAKIQTDIASGNAPMKDGKVDPEWLQKRREEYNTDMLTRDEKQQAQFLQDKVKKGIDLDSGEKQFYNNPIIQDYLKSFEKSSKIIKNELNRNNDPSLADVLAKYGNKNTPLDSAIEAQATNSELKNEVAGKVARASVEARTASINKTKSNFDEHTASLIKYYSKGSGNP